MSSLDKPNTPQSDQVVEPNGVIGILGGGQLGRMLAIAAAPLGLKTHILEPDDHCPAADVAAKHMIASYTDESALAEFAKSVDIITFEFENVPADTLNMLAALGARVAPEARALSVAQDRLHEKDFCASIGVRTAPYHAVDNLAALHQGLKEVGTPAILKTRRLGYDGKGQTHIAAHNNDLTETWEKAQIHAWEAVGARPSILEGFIPFEREISIIGARNAKGDIALYDIVENAHSNGILITSCVPAAISKETSDSAKFIMTRMLMELDYIGVMAVEFFVLRNGELLVNEIAPRVHNSGHWTINACAVSQFEQHLRAIAGWPLGDPERHSDAVMKNLIGPEALTWRDLSRQSNTCLHLYGKREAREGRKMGHLTILNSHRNES